MLERTPDTSRLLPGLDDPDPTHWALELGHEPPLDLEGLAAPPGDRRKVNLRWLIGSVMTGLSGALLLGTAIVMSVESDNAILEQPERLTPQVSRAADGGPVISSRKADRLVRDDLFGGAKQAMKAPMTLRVGNREVIKVRSFVRVATALSLTSGQYATDIPPFNPLKLFADGNDVPERAADQPDTGDAEVSIVKHNLNNEVVGNAAPALSDEDAAAQASEEARMLASGGASTILPIPPQMMLERTLRRPLGQDLAQAFGTPVDTSFSKIEVKFVPENVTVLDKAPAVSGEPPANDRVVQLKHDETLEQLLRAQGASDDHIRAILKALSGRVNVTSLPEGQRIKLLIGPGPGPGNPKQVLRVMILGDHTIDAIAAIDDQGQFVSVAPPETDDASVTGKPIPEEADQGDEDTGGVRLYDSLYETAAKNNLSPTLVKELIRIFAYDVDFQHRVSAGDNLELFYTSNEDQNGEPEILYASITIDGDTHSIYRYQSPTDGSVDYFDQNGRSLKKFLLRKPVAGGRLTSGFGMRYHPVLHYSKMHTGVDWASGIGTPILAAGDGVVIKAGWSSGYGRHTEIQHANGYVTTYSHQSAFAKGIHPGMRVHQGQIIGYMGSSGLSTGSHLHYEVLVNGHFVNPLKIKLPHGRELSGRALAEFKRQRDEVKTLLAKAANAPYAQTAQQ